MKYEVEVQIAATPDVIWEALADVERWPEWTASVSSVQRLESGPLAVGSTARVVQPKVRPAVYTVTACEPGASFVWTAKGAGITTVAGHYIEALGDGKSAVRLVFEQTGLLTPLVGLFAGSMIRRYLALESESLKKVSERR